MIPQEVQDLARELYKSSMTIDAWDKEQEHVKMRFITEAQRIIAAINSAGYTLVEKAEVVEDEKPILLDDDTGSKPSSPEQPPKRGRKSKK